MNASSQRIALITDSTSDLSPDFLRQYGIYVAPQMIMWGTEEFRDRVDMQSDEFYRRLASDPRRPTTSQATVAAFLDQLQAAERDGAEEAVIIVLSNQLSGTIKSAQQAAEMVSLKTHIYDSLTAAMALGWQVIAAARAREAGADAAGMIAAADRARQTMAFYFYIDTLEYLHRGGRIGSAQKLIGTALNIKPLLYVDHSVGRVEPGDKVRTKSKALERLYQVFFEKMEPSRPLHIAVEHANSEDVAEGIAARIRREHPSAEVVTGIIAPAVGAHIGPGGVGIMGYYE